MSYIPHTDRERAEMLTTLGLDSLDRLFDHVPQDLKFAGFKTIPPGLNELELSALLKAIGSKNRPVSALTCFLGAGAYDHFIPPAVLELISRGELYSAYTPYQPEISQGVLQAIYEYQSMIASLTGCDVANASLYDGATALVEACQMAVRQSGRNAVLLDGTLHPFYLRTAQALLNVQTIDVQIAAPAADGLQSDQTGLRERIATSGERLAAVVTGYPNFYGCLQDPAPMAEAIHRQGGFSIVVANPFLLGVLTPPGQLGADIVCGEAQSLGVPLQFGGPYLGYLACTKELVRRIPGRLVGQTLDRQQRRCFTLTLQAREQHIRREKATSNICTNTALCAMMAHFYMSCLGDNGLKRAGELALCKADLLRRKLRNCNSVSKVPEYSCGNEFVYETKAPAAEVLKRLLDHEILGGLDLGTFDQNLKHRVLVCVTEKRSESEIDRYVEILS